MRPRDADGQRVWTATLPEVQQGHWYFRQLFVGPATERSFSRRYRPHLGMKATAGLTYSPARKTMAHRASQKDFVFFKGDIQAWENLSDVEVVVLHLWSTSRLLIHRLDLEKAVVEFTGFPLFRVGHWWSGGRNPYYVENVKEALHQAGQWYLDRKSGELRYLPLPGESLENTRLVAPILVRLVAIEGDWAHDCPVQHVVFRNLTFCHNESPLPKTGSTGAQGQPELPAAIELTGASGIEFVGCTIAHVGDYGLGLGKGCHGNRVVGCRLADLAGGGVKIGDVTMNRNASVPELPTDNVVENCAISDGGLMSFSANAIWAGIVRGTVLRHNEIWNFPYAGIAVGWQWNDTPTSCGGNRIEDNLIHNVCTLLADGASLYTLGRQPGTIIRGNVLRDNPKSRFALHDWQLGIYLDEGSSQMLVENNLLYHVGTHGFNLNGGAENVVRNNIFGPVYGNFAPFHRCHNRPYAHDNVFERNITWCDSPNLADRPWEKGLMLCRNNLYFNTAGESFVWKDKSFTEWQATGQDAGSVLADPRFEDPHQGNFTLKPDSPALKLGFQPFDFTRAGLEPDYRPIKTGVTVTPAPLFDLPLPPATELPPGFNLDFEDVPLGRVPYRFDCLGSSPQATFQVTDESAWHGRRSLKVTDARSAAKSFYPLLVHKPPKPLDTGRVSFSCAVRIQPDAPLMLDVVFRDYTKRGHPTKEYTSGPSVQFHRDGQVTLGTQRLAQFSLGQWIELHVDVDFQSRTARVSVQSEGVAAKQASFPLSKEFAAFTWLGLIAGEGVDGAAYIDDMKLVHEPL